MNNYPFPSSRDVEVFRKALHSEQGAFGPFMITSDPAFVEAAGYAGYDFVLLDMEHGPGTFENLQNLIRAANVSGVCPVVRVPRGMDIRREILSPRHPWDLPLCPFRRLWCDPRCGLLCQGTGHHGDPSGRGSEGH